MADQDEEEKTQVSEIQKLQQLMGNMEAQLVKGGEALEEAEKQKAQEQRRLQLELEQQRQQ